MALATWQGPTFGAPGAHSAIGPAMYRALQDPRDYSRLWPAKLGRKTGLSRLERPASEQLFPRPYSSSLVLRETQRFPVSTQASRRNDGRNGGRRGGGRINRFNRRPGNYIVGQSKATVTNVLIVLNIIFFLFQQINPRFTQMGIRSNELVRYGDGYRMWTSVFLHGGILHLLVNSLTLRAYGPEVERMHGKVRFITIYLMAGFIGNLVGFLYGDYYQNSLGASGAIFGVIGALFMYMYRAERRVSMQPVNVSMSSLVWTIAFNMIYGLQRGSHIDNYAHIGGLAGGAAMAFLIGPTKGSPIMGRGASPDRDRPIVPPLGITAIFTFSMCFLIASMLPMAIEMMATLSFLGRATGEIFFGRLGNSLRYEY
ncbi:hypothetical protein AAMO2058_000660000 [Amorphochlora amoebiformis]